MKSKIFTPVSILLTMWAIAHFVFFQFYYKFHLAYRLDIQLFLYSSDYIKQYFQHPAWLSTLAGDFLTQFYYFNIWGAFTNTVCTLITGTVLFRSIQHLWPQSGKQTSSTWYISLLTILYVVWESVRNFDMYYSLSSTLSVLGGLVLFLLYRKISERRRYIFILPIAALSYWMFGYGLIPFGLAVMIFELRYGSYYLAIMCFTSTVVIPLSTRQYYELTLSQSYSYAAGTIGVKPDFVTERLLQYNTLASNNRWNQLAILTEKSKISNGLDTYFFSLSHGMRGDLPEQLMTHAKSGPNGLIFQLSPTISPLAIWSSNEVWFQLGDMTMAEHSALLGMIFSPNHRSVRMIKRLAEINMINADTAATQKYLNMLQKTWLYKTWAQERIPGKETNAVKGWLERKRANIAQTDTVRDSSNPQTSLRVLLDSNKANKLALDYLLCYDLLTKDIDGFMADYDQYFISEASVPGEIYSQALLIGHLRRKTPEKEMQRYKIMPTVYSDFTNYNTLNEKKIFGEKYFIDQFGKSYWFYFNYAKFK